MNVQHPAERLGQSTVSSQKIGSLRCLAVFLEQAELFVDQGDQAIFTQVGKPIQIPQRTHAVARVPAQ